MYMFFLLGNWWGRGRVGPARDEEGHPDQWESTERNPREPCLLPRRVWPWQGFCPRDWRWCQFPEQFWPECHQRYASSSRGGHAPAKAAGAYRKAEAGCCQFCEGMGAFRLDKRSWLSRRNWHSNWIIFYLEKKKVAKFFASLWHNGYELLSIISHMRLDCCLFTQGSKFLMSFYCNFPSELLLVLL